MTDRRSNAGEPIGGADNFETTKAEEMAAYDALPYDLRRQIDLCVHEFSALQVTQMMQDSGTTPEEFAARFRRHNQAAIEKQRKEIWQYERSPRSSHRTR